ncbi:Disabled 2-interacting protein [Sparganum proliferum]
MPLFSVRKQIKSWSLDHDRRSVVESSDKGNNHGSKATIKQNKMTPGRSKCTLKPQDVRYSSLTKTTFERHNESIVSDDQPNRIVESVYVEKHERPRLSRARSLNRPATLKGNSTPQPRPDIQHRPAYRKKIFRIFSKEHPQNNLEEKKEIPHYYQKRTLSETRKSVTMEVDISPVRCVNNVISALKANVDTLRFTVASLDDSLMESGLKNCFEISTHFTNKTANAKPVYDEKSCPLGQQEKHSVVGKFLAPDLDRHFDVPETSVDSGKFVRMRNHPMNGQPGQQQTTCQFSTAAIRSVHRIYTCQSSAERDYWLNK